MKTIKLSILPIDLDAFKLACEILKDSIDLVSINEKNEATIKYKYDHSLFYLGKMVEIKNEYLNLVK